MACCHEGRGWFIPEPRITDELGDNQTKLSIRYNQPMNDDGWEMGEFIYAVLSVLEILNSCFLPWQLSIIDALQT